MDPAPITAARRQFSESQPWERRCLRSRLGGRLASLGVLLSGQGFQIPLGKSPTFHPSRHTLLDRRNGASYHRLASFGFVFRLILSFASR